MAFNSSKKNSIMQRFRPRDKTPSEARERASAKNSGRDNVPSIGREVARESFDRAVKALEMNQ